MPAPTPLDVATQSVQRLVKEETSYHKELGSQKARVAKIESEISAGTGDENAEYILKQEVGALIMISTHKLHPSCSHSSSTLVGIDRFY